MRKIKKTKSLIALLEAFEQTDEAISLADLIDRHQRQMNRTTVYRILQRLEERGTLHSFIGKDGLRWYAKCKDHAHEHQLDMHPHFQCRDCGKVECLPLDISIPLVPDYKIDSAKFLLIGQCKDCLSQC